MNFKDKMKYLSMLKDTIEFAHKNMPDLYQFMKEKGINLVDFSSFDFSIIRRSVSTNKRLYELIAKLEGITDERLEKLSKRQILNIIIKELKKAQEAQ